MLLFAIPASGFSSFFADSLRIFGRCGLCAVLQKVRLAVPVITFTVLLAATPLIWLVFASSIYGFLGYVMFGGALAVLAMWFVFGAKRFKLRNSISPKGTHTFAGALLRGIGLLLIFPLPFLIFCLIFLLNYIHFLASCLSAFFSE